MTLAHVLAAFIMIDSSATAPLKRRSNEVGCPFLRMLYICLRVCVIFFEELWVNVYLATHVSLSDRTEADSAHDDEVRGLLPLFPYPPDQERPPVGDWDVEVGLPELEIWQDIVLVDDEVLEVRRQHVPRRDALPSRAVGPPP
ncbi:hypothetical protein E4U42_002650 [Claviceps africana]|uniref:Uncharacterized protein n=1 Tax=Claviceps africana TaxID=83212 RepID=A0A8K0JAF2_9HYPO|nr:hypothetical protein E4U42_002650 [Claviceps africana]